MPGQYVTRDNPEPVNSGAAPVYEDNDSHYQLPGSYATRDNPDVAVSVKAGVYAGSMERVARSMLGPNASQREINNYVGQLAEINGINDFRRVPANKDILLPDASTPAATKGLAIYGKDIALGEQMKLEAAPVVRDAPVFDGDITLGDLDVLNAAFGRRDQAVASLRNFVGPLQPPTSYGEIKPSPEIGLGTRLASAVFGEPIAFAKQLAGGLPVNPITNELMNFEGADRKLLAMLGVAPLPFAKAGSAARIGDDLATVAARELLVSESRAQATALQAKYGAMGSEQRLARIQELALGNRVLREAGVEPSYISSALQSFEPGTMRLRFAGEDDYGLRFYGGVSGPKSPYLNPTFPLGDARALNAVPDGNTMQNVVQWQIHPGTPLLEGRIRNAFGQPGGGQQIYVPNFRQNLIDPRRGW